MKIDAYNSSGMLPLYGIFFTFRKTFWTRYAANQKLL